MDNPQEFAGFLAWGFYTLLTGVIAFAAYSIREDFKEMTKVMHDLSVSVAKLSEGFEYSKQSLDRLEKRLEKLEDLGNN